MGTRHYALRNAHYMIQAASGHISKMAGNLVDTEINSVRIAAVENCFGVAGQPLAIPGRVLIGEGILTKECRKKPKPRMFFLFSDILVYGNIVINKRKYNSQHIIPLEDVTMETLEDLPDIENRWMIKTSKKTFVVSAASATERREWIQHIEQCVKQLCEKTGRTTPTEHAAPWIPDRATDICMRCTQKKFSLVTRRHHCRKCGFVVCRNCSSYRFLLPKLDQKPLRVCGLCYKQLLAEKAEEAEAERRRSARFNSEVPVHDPSSDDSDGSTEADYENMRAWNTEFYLPPV
ncbi:pleckstrin homology domain-containing family F member 1 isoform X1 [Ambystoma mexicanum]|uniref:pleckstrin homology domain-containing family F member 1 isoform X1 n=3 Tax=Ambystoma mexicanum TaxID=8296 RepID=UPI0037E7C90F